MLRLRRYRPLLLFAAITIFTLYHFSALREKAFGDPAQQLKKYTAESPVVPVHHHDNPPSTAPLEDENPQTPLLKEEAPIQPPPIPVIEKPPPRSSVVPAAKETPKPIVEELPSLPKKESVSPTIDDNVVPPRPAETPVKDVVPEEAVHWQKSPEHYPLPSKSIIPIPTSKKRRLPRIQASFAKESDGDKNIRIQRRDAVREAFKRSWESYRKYAWGHDELAPVTKSYKDPFGGWGATLVDALDTLWIMGFEHEFVEAVNMVAKIDFTTTIVEKLPVFETTIRYLGGLLGAYDISGGKHHILLAKAIELGDILYGVFDTPNRMPITMYQWKPSDLAIPRRASAGTVAAELGSLSLEFTRLAQITGNNSYFDAIQRITDALEVYQFNTSLPGLFPLTIDASGCKPYSPPPQPVAEVHPVTLPRTGIFAEHDGAGPVEVPGLALEPRVNSPIHAKRDRFEGGNGAQSTDQDEDRRPNKIGEKSTAAATPEPTCIPQGLAAPRRVRDQVYAFSGMIDSLYEYLIKEWVLLGGVSDQYKKLYESAIDVAKDRLFYRPLAEGDPDILLTGKVHVIEGAETFEPEGSHLACFSGGMLALGARALGREEDLAIGGKLTEGCVWAYGSMPTGVMPETFQLAYCKDKMDCHFDDLEWMEQLMPYRNWPEKPRRLQEPHQHAKRLVEEDATDGNLNSTESSNEDTAGDGSTEPSNEDTAGGGSTESSDENTASDGSTKSSDGNTAGDGNTESLDEEESPEEETPEQMAKRITERERLPKGWTKIHDRRYIMRPEAIESVFIMYRLTADKKWQDKGWKMFESVENVTRTEIAYSAINDVTRPELGGRYQKANSLESFWFAETLKYFYLLYSEPNLVSLDDYVLNTEAHPLRIPKPRWKKKEKN